MLQFILVAALFAVAAASEVYEKDAPAYSAPAYEEVTYVSLNLYPNSLNN